LILKVSLVTLGRKPVLIKYRCYAALCSCF